MNKIDRRIFQNIEFIFWEGRLIFRLINSKNEMGEIKQYVFPATLFCSFWKWNNCQTYHIHIITITNKMFSAILTCMCINKPQVTKETSAGRNLWVSGFKFRKYARRIGTKMRFFIFLWGLVRWSEAQETAGPTGDYSDYKL